MGKNPTSLSINTINEGTSGSGVTVDGVKHKDYNLYVGDYGSSAALPTGHSGIAIADFTNSTIQFNTVTTGFTASDGFFIGVTNADAYITNREAANIIFSTESVERFRLTNALSGESFVKFGTSSSEPAYISGSTNDGVVINTTTGHMEVSCTLPALAVNRSSTDGIVVDLNRNGAPVGSISVTASAAAFNTSSDYRLKEDIQPMVNACERLKTLKPVNFAWKVDGTRVDGFIAHEAQEVVPEAVVGTKDAVDENQNPIYQGIDQAKLVPLLTKALQEALARIEALENA
jgi:hypothetical protein